MKVPKKIYFYFLISAIAIGFVYIFLGPYGNKKGSNLKKVLPDQSHKGEKKSAATSRQGIEQKQNKASQARAVASLAGPKNTKIPLSTPSMKKFFKRLKLPRKNDTKEWKSFKNNIYQQLADASADAMIQVKGKDFFPVSQYFASSFALSEYKDAFIGKQGPYFIYQSDSYKNKNAPQNKHKKTIFFAKGHHMGVFDGSIKIIFKNFHSKDELFSKYDLGPGIDLEALATSYVQTQIQDIKMLQELISRLESEDNILSASIILEDKVFTTK